MNPLLIIALIAGAGYYLFGKAKDLSEKLQYTLEEISLDKKKTSLYNIVFNIKLGIQNPTDTAFEFTGINAQALYNNKIFGNILFTDKVKVPAESRTVISFPVKMPVLPLTTNVAEMVINAIKKNENPTITIDG